MWIGNFCIHCSADCIVLFRKTIRQHTDDDDDDDDGNDDTIQGGRTEYRKVTFDICCHLNPLITMSNSVWSIELEIGIYCLVTDRPVCLFILELNILKRPHHSFWNKICSICWWWWFCCIFESNFFLFRFFAIMQELFQCYVRVHKEPKTILNVQCAHKFNV